MITYEDALRFRQDAGLPLAWDDDVPPPPRDRVEFTRLILQAAEETGLTVVASEPLNRIDPEKQIEKFQVRIHRYTHRQSCRGVPQPDYVEGTLTWEEYIGQLEKDYYELWKTSWQFGVLEGREERALLLIKKCVYTHYEESNPLFRARVGEDIKESDAIADYLSADGGSTLEHCIRWNTGIQLSLVKYTWMGVLRNALFFILPIFNLLCLIGAVTGAVLNYYSGWHLLWIVPLLLATPIWWEAHNRISPQVYWRDKELTFNELVQQIVKTNKRQWEELQHKYRIEH